jgi:hypothetical protein
MIITNSKSLYITNIKNLVHKIHKYKLFYIILLNLIVVSLLPIALFESKSAFPNYQKAKSVIANSFQLIGNVINGITVNANNLDIKIKDIHLKELNYIKEMSTKHYIGQDNLDEVSLMRKKWFPAEISYNGKDYKVAIRIKGQSHDHWGKYPSYKIKVKSGETIFGMKRFALQHPITRGYLNEWVYHQFLKYNGLIFLRYDFVRLSINGDSLPIYAVEENFEKRLIENNLKKDGIIFRINYDPENRITIQQSRGELNKDFMKEKKPLLKTKLNLFFEGKINSAQIFDVRSFAKLYAILDLWGNRHAGQLKNIRLYLNPHTALIEPISYDQQVIWPTEHLGLIGGSMISGGLLYQKHFFDMLFNDKEFYHMYMEELHNVSNLDLDLFFSSIEADLNKNKYILYKSYPYYELKSKYPTLEWFWQDRNTPYYQNSLWFPSDNYILYNNQQYIKNTLKINKSSLLVNSSSVNTDNITMFFKNNEILPIEITDIIFQDKSVIQESVLVYSKNKLLDNNFIKMVFPVKTTNGDFKDNGSSISLSYKFVGIDDSVTSNIKLTQHFIANNTSDNRFKLTNFKDSNVNIDEHNKSITFTPGTNHINSDFIIPDNYSVKALPGAEIILNNANIISYSPIIFAGTEEKPILFHSISKGGLSVINTSAHSKVEYVRFDNLSAPATHELFFSGGANFYNANVKFSNCEFTNNKSEDSLNIIKSDFVIDKCKFYNSQSDSFDSDFSNGNIKNTLFTYSGNDAVDISGGNVYLQNLTINNSKDKGVSIGENSTVNINRIEISDSKIAIAVKDKSKLYIDSNLIKNLGNSIYSGIFINNCEIGFAVYQKKSEYGPAEVHIGKRSEHFTNMIINNTKNHFMVEENSFMEIGSKSLNNYMKNVFSTLYK